MSNDCVKTRTIQNVNNRLAILPSYITPPVASSHPSPHFRTPSTLKWSQWLVFSFVSLNVKSSYMSYYWTKFRFNEQGFDFHHLNGKLLPMLEYNRRQMQHKYDLSHQDYYDVENFMFRINQRVKNRPFRFGDGCVSKAFGNVYINYKSVYDCNH